MTLFLGLSCDRRHRLPEVDVTQQISIVSINRTSTSENSCEIPPWLRQPGCHHRADILQTNLHISPPLLPEPSLPKSVCEPNTLQMLKHVSEQMQVEMPEPCQCSPEKMKEIFEQVLRAKLSLKSTGCGGALNLTNKQPNIPGICNKSQVLDTVFSNSGNMIIPLTSIIQVRRTADVFIKLEAI